MRNILYAFFGVAMLAAVTTALGQMPLIDRDVLFGNPQYASARISPDGKTLAYLAPVEGVLNVHVAPANNLAAAKAVTKDTGRGIRSFTWTYTPDILLYSQDTDGDEDFHLYAVNINSGTIKDLTPLEKIRAQIGGASEKFPRKILVGINDRPPHALHDLYEIDVITGERTLVEENPGFVAMIADDDYRVRFGMAFTPTAEIQVVQKTDEGYEPYLTIGSEDSLTTSPAGFDKTGTKLYMIDSRGRNTGVLKQIDIATGAETILAADDKSDVGGVLVHPTEKTIQAVAFNYKRQDWKILDPAIRPDLEYLATVDPGDVEVTSRSLDDKVWTVAYLRDAGSTTFYLYDRSTLIDGHGTATLLFSSRPELDELPLVAMHPVVIDARDGQKLVSYLSLPAIERGNPAYAPPVPATPLPMVLLVHGGPWARDTWGYDPEHQLLANRGYAVLSVNYRGSTGFGKEFTNAGNRQWAESMHDDLLDAVDWAVKRGYADPDHVAIMGGSYGGYATLVGLTFTPERFACGVDIVGPSSLVTLLENPPPYWAPFMPVMKQRVGDWQTPEGREFLLSRSPLTKVDQIRKPLLIGQGAQDPRVKRAEADQIVAAMEEKRIPVTYVLFPKEGHGFAKPENRIAFYAITEPFLAEHLGGRYQPIGDAFTGAEFEVVSGADQVPGLPKALETMPASR